MGLDGRNRATSLIMLIRVGSDCTDTVPIVWGGLKEFSSRMSTVVMAASCVWENHC